MLPVQSAHAIKVRIFSSSAYLSKIILFLKEEIVYTFKKFTLPATDL